jgi:transcriptional regulator with XRE-family HTH domain
MANDKGASVRQRRVSAELRALRLEKGLTCQQVADALDWSISKVSRMETGIRGLFPDDVAALLGYLEAPSKLRDELLTLVRDGEKLNWIQIGRGIPSDWKNLIRIENEAIALYNYEPLVVPGLFQTGDYARAVIRACNCQLAEGAADQMVRTRIGRQELLSRPDGPTFEVIIDEMALRRPIGEPGVMRGQLQHLLNTANRPRINLRMLPFAVGAHSGLEGAFMILAFDAQPTLVYQDNRGTGGFLEEGRHVARAKLDWRELSSKALSPEDSAQFIAGLVGEMPTR